MIWLTNQQTTDILSIDSAYRLSVFFYIREVGLIKLSVQSKEKEIIEFLAMLKGILRSKTFSVEQDLTIIRSKKPKGKELYSTGYTMLDLEYDAYDVVERLLELTVQEYSETLVDKDDVNPPLLFVFGKDINENLVYIKLKIKGDAVKHVLCVSFHYAEEPMRFPYA